MSGVPEGWASTTVGELVDFNPKHQPATERSASVSFVPMAGVDEHSGAIVLKENRALSEVWKGYTHFADEDVLFAKITPCMENGKAAIASDLTSGLGCGSTEFHVLRSTGAIEPKLLWRYLRQREFRSRAERSMTGAVGQRRVPVDFLRSEPLPLPPVAEQRRIVAKIDRLSARSKRARDELACAEMLVQRLKSSVATSEFLRCQRRVGCVRSLSELTFSTFYGPRIAAEAYVPDGVPTLRTTDISDWGSLNLQDPPRVHVSPNKMSKWELLDGDLIVTRTGATIGKCAVYHEEMGPALPSAYLIRVRLDRALLHPSFAILFLLSPEGQRQLLAGRTATAQPNINANTILALRLPVPPFEEQSEIVRRIEHAFAAIDRLAAETRSAHALLDTLDEAILAKAFRGELVPQDPNDEPASVLLARIREERAAAPATSRGRKARAARADS